MAFRLLSQYPIAAISAAGIVAGFVLLAINPLAARGAFALVSIGCGIPLIWSTARNMLKGRFFVDIVAALAIVSSVAMGEFLAGALVVSMQSGGEALEDYGLRRANRSLDNLLRRAPTIAHRKSGGNYVDVPAADLAIGDIILVRAGDIIAADGLVVEGTGSVDESAMTGEPVPLAKLPGDKVFSGTINLSGSFQVRTTNTASESKYELIVRMVQQAEGEQAPINRLANTYTPAFTILTMLVSGLALLVTHDTHRALAVLVVATPCPLIIATPLAVLSAINRAASLNIIVKSGAAIEMVGEVDIVVFDKTGTLTSGQPAISEIVCYDGLNRVQNGADSLLKDAAAVELHSVHILATSVLNAARGRDIAVKAATDVREAPGTGVSGIVEGHRVSIGSGKFLESQGVRVPDLLREERARHGTGGKTVAYVARDSNVAGLLIFEDRVRTEAAALLHRLDRIGIKRTVMLTGDAPETANAVAAQIGIRDVRSRLHPDDKVTAITELSQSGHVMMVGDGINDAPALATAHVGVAMGGYGAGIATDAADMVITVENVERVADAIDIGRRMVRVAKQGILFGIGASFILMILATFGLFPPAVGALLQEMIDLAAILNALRAR